MPSLGIIMAFEPLFTAKFTKFQQMLDEKMYGNLL